MADKAAFALKESVQDFAGGSTTLTDGRTLDFGARLKNGDGVIVVSDPEEIAALGAVPALKSVPVPAQSKSSKTSKEGDR